MLNTQIICHIY